MKSALIAILVPLQEQLEAWCIKNNIAGKLENLCKDKRVKEMLLNELHALGRKAGLKSFEQVKQLLVEPELFSIENGMLTPTLKAKREKIFKHYEKEINQIYSKLD